MRIFALFLGAALVITQTVSSVLAEDNEVCGMLLPNDFVVGNYTMTLGPGAYTVGTIVKSYPKQHVVPATVYSSGGKLALVSDHGFNMVFKDVEFDERDWKFEKGDYGMSLSASDFALSLGCANANELPRLQATGTGSYFANDGAKVPTFMKLFVYGIEKEKGIKALGGMLAKAPHGVVFKLRVKLEPN